MKRRAKRDCRSFHHRARTAVHEAAHAVAAVVLKRNLKWVTIVPIPSACGRYLAEGSLRTRRQREDEIVTLWAGSLGEGLYANLFLSEDSDAVRVSIECGGYDDLRELGKLLKGLKGNSEYHKALGTRIGSFVRAHLSLIEVLAGALMEARTLSAVEVRRVLAADANANAEVRTT